MICFEGVGDTNTVRAMGMSFGGVVVARPGILLGDCGVVLRGAVCVSL